MIKLYLSGNCCEHYTGSERLLTSLVSEAGVQKRWAIISPHRDGRASGWKGYLDVGLEMMLYCDAVVTPNHICDCQGCSAERNFAEQIGLKVGTIPEVFNNLNPGSEEDTLSKWAEPISGGGDISTI